MDAIEKKILQSVESHAEELICFAKALYSAGEPGYREFKTAQKTMAFFDRLGLPYTKGLAITGVKAVSKGKKNGPTLALLGELDGIMCQKHPFANPENGISHTCGHNIQLTAMLGCALVFSQPEIRDSMAGDLVYFAVPAEEYTDLEYKYGLMKQNKIKYGGGKAELVRIGAFDDIDMCINHHLHMVDTPSDLQLGNNTSNGLISKKITMLGKSAHAANAPHNGVNALNAVSIAMTAAAYQRETFRDDDYVRFHGIITKGGGMVNVVPDEVVMEAQVRAKTMSAMLDAEYKVNRCFEAGAHAVGARLEMENQPGYLPILPYPVTEPLSRAGAALEKEYTVSPADLREHNRASTDVGDLSHLMPILGFTTGGFTGSLHGADFQITDERKAYLLPVKAMALTAYHALKEDAVLARQLLHDFSPALTKEEYLKYMDGFSGSTQAKATSE